MKRSIALSLSCVKVALIIAVLVFLVCSSCDGTSGEVRGAVCRHKAVLAALVYCEEYPVRVAWGPVNEKEGYHSQAQAYIPGESGGAGEWRWLRVFAYGSEIQVEIGEQDDWFTVTRTFTLKEFLDWDWFNRGYGIQEVV